jgi:hypothetical protein
MGNGVLNMSTACMNGYNVFEFTGKKVFLGNTESNNNGAFLEVPYTTYSDYLGGTVERSNNEVFLNRFGHLDGVYTLCGAGTVRSVLISRELYNTNNEIRDLIKGLEEYPALDDENLSKVENELFEESWEDWIRADLITELKKQGKIEEDFEFSEVDEAYLLEIFMNKYYQYVVFESGGAVYVDIKQVASKWMTE